MSCLPRPHAGNNIGEEQQEARAEGTRTQEGEKLADISEQGHQAGISRMNKPQPDVCHKAFQSFCNQVRVVVARDCVMGPVSNDFLRVWKQILHGYSYP